MYIRQEMPADHSETYEVVKAAFSSAEESDGNEHHLVTALRNSRAFIPELSLVALDNERIVGHILYTKIDIGGQTELALAPLSVLPAYQRQGVGKSLMQAGHQIAKQLGYNFSVVLGSPYYYPKAGYIPASVYGIFPPFDVADENYMALKLNPDAPSVSGTVIYDPAFDET